MDCRRATVLLVALLVLAAGGRSTGAEGPGGWQEGGHTSQEEAAGTRLPRDAQGPGSLLSALLQAMQRPSRSLAFLFQPQRFGRNAQRSWSNERLSPRAGAGPSSQFWNLAAPQRFGKK
ncbi:PREDICTED: pro-FMRFamide-related neuropeptide FF [Condylura cristata]|uniref:pro-FMRFamide-related neuropeptide FF n=1 Tax=Condylura cristata TaxID=143302 RepID=UPI0006435CB9|nr:PREDICTED: pro-FMRFamide-related neuropeptide FF [Condylura cristata]